MTENALVPAELSGGGQMLLAEHVVLGVAGLQIAEGATSDELQGVARGFDSLARLTGFAVGDLANFYKRHFAEDFQTWVNAYPVETKNAELDQKTIKVYAAVAAFYPLDVRERYLVQWEGRRALSFSHFSRVKRYGLQTAQYWLERAATEDLSLPQLEEIIEATTVPGADDAPALPTIADSMFGFVYDLGHGHMLLCGDSRLPEHVQALFEPGETAAMIWTDPPYGVEYVGKTEESLTIQNDGADDLEGLLAGAWTSALAVCEPAAPFYCAGPSGSNAETFFRSFRLKGMLFKEMLVWVKNRMILGRADYHYQHEPVYYGQLPGPSMGRMTGAKLNWFAGDNETTIFNVDSPPASREHPTMKPVDLIRPAIRNSSNRGEIVLDLFGGSGSTLIASHIEGRRCRLVEFDPRYADVIRTRFANFLALQEEEGIEIQPETPPPVIEGTATVMEQT